MSRNSNKIICQRCGKEMGEEAGIPALSYSIETNQFYTALCHTNCKLFGDKPEDWRWLGWAIGMKSSWRWVPNEPKLSAIFRIYRLRLSKQSTVYVRTYYRSDIQQSVVIDASGTLWRLSAGYWVFYDPHKARPYIDAFLNFDV